MPGVPEQGTNDVPRQIRPFTALEWRGLPVAPVLRATSDLRWLGGSALVVGGLTAARRT